MTPHGTLTARVVRRLPDLVASLALPEPPPAVRTAELTVGALVRGLDEGHLADDELVALRDDALRHAEHGAPLGDLITSCHAAAHVVWTALVDEAGEHSTEAVRGLGEALFRLLEQLTVTVAVAFLEEEHAIRGDLRDARRALATALIAGEPFDNPAAQLGIRVAPAYVALALQLALPSPDGPEGDGARDAAATRQRLRRLQERLDRFAGENVLGLLDPTGGTVLLPSTPDRVTTMLDDLPALVAAIRTATSIELIGGAAGCVGVVAVSRAARQARDVLSIARRLGRPPGVYVLDDVLLEYQLTRDSDALPLLVGLLDPLEGNPDLVRTLECYFEHDFDRRSTAADLHVHPNTLDYRLRRISQLTGLDPGKPSGQQLLAAALTARRVV